MKYVLLGFALSCFAYSASAQNETKPTVLLVDAITEYESLESSFPMTTNFLKRATESLEEICLGKTQIAGSHKKASHISMAEKEQANVVLQLEVSFTYDYLKVKSKKKWEVGLGGIKGLKFKYWGEIDITPEAYLIIRDPDSFSLIERREIDLSEVTAMIQYQEVSPYANMETTLLSASVKGVTDVVDKTVQKINTELEDELMYLFQDEKFISSLLKY